jgi:plasmid maintenance system antidote protein VapI
MEDCRGIIELYPKMSTPFGQLLLYFMDRQHVSSAQLAKRMSVSTRVVSGLLTGARDRIAESLVLGVCQSLALSEADQKQLEQAARFSQTLYRLPPGNTGWNYALMSKFVDNLANLSPSMGRIIDSTLDAAAEPSLGEAPSVDNDPFKRSS